MTKTDFGEPVCMVGPAWWYSPVSARCGGSFSRRKYSPETLEGLETAMLENAKTQKRCLRPFSEILSSMNGKSIPKLVM
jgi:hypothetical protein